MASRDRDRVVALSLQLAQAHQELRRQIELLKAGLEQPQPTGALLTRCLVFCAALTSHHRGEDGGLFADLLRQRPDQSGTVAKLVEDHEMIASILARVAEIAGQISGSAGSAADSTRLELDGLTAIMESHFAYEERAIGAALVREG
jgi:hemerythrin-like domain-containing protein